MRSAELKHFALDVLGSAPEPLSLCALHSARPRELRAFLQWLDHSGLALYFAIRLKRTAQWGEVSANFRAELDRRVEANVQRTEALLADFGAVSASLRSHGVPHAFLKGFTLAPAFCPDRNLRHQSDVDVIVVRDFLDAASRAVVACGYRPQHVTDPCDFRFATPATRVPTLRDDIYSLPPQREVELHTSIWSSVGGVHLEVPQDFLSRTEPRELRGISFDALALDDAFLVQVLHAFGHLLGSWLRVAWLWEIHYFIETHADHGQLWQSFCERTGNDPRMRNAIGLVLCLTQRLFRTRVPFALHARYLEPLPGQISAWVAHCGTRWALSEIAGSKLSLFVHREFFPGDAEWRAYFLHRMIPCRPKTSPASAHASDGKTGFRGHLAQVDFILRRLLFHAGAAISFSWETVRWRHALHASRRARAASS
jgi:hypothetical protein